MWGPAAWAYLHYTASVVEDIESFKLLLYASARTLPCPICRNHFAEYLIKNPMTSIIDNVTASRYLYNFHNVINKKTGKPLFPVQAFVKKYQVQIA